MDPQVRAALKAALKDEMLGAALQRIREITPHAMLDDAPATEADTAQAMKQEFLDRADELCAQIQEQQGVFLGEELVAIVKEIIVEALDEAFRRVQQ